MGQDIFMTAVFAFYAGKAVVRVAAVQIPVDHLLDIGPPESVLPRETVVIFLHKGFKIILDAVVIILILQVAWPVFGCCQWHVFLAS